MKKLLCILFVFGCSHSPVIPPVVIPPVVITPSVPSVPVPVVKIESVVSIADNSKCISYSWKNRGVAPKSYIRGMALAYAHEVCFPNKVVNSPLGASDKDALVHYGLKADAVNVYAMLIGSGMRESSGKYCEGRDMSASNTSATSAEAGMFQTSYNSRTSSPELGIIFNSFKSDFVNCLDIFKENVKCTATNNTVYGTGDGRDFQQMARTCPLFAVKFAAVTFRTLYKHYGPIVRKEVEVLPVCIDMLTAVKIQMKARPELCKEL